MKTPPVKHSRGKCAQFAAVLTVALTACGPEEEPVAGSSEPASRPPSSATTSRAAHIREVQATAGAAYAIQNVGGVLHARHPTQGFDVDFGSSVGLRLPGDERLSLTTTGYGCEGGARPVAAAQPVATGNRVEYARRGGASGELTEWYVHGPLGLEQGFTLDAPLGCGDRDVVVEMELGGTLSASAGGKGVVALRNARGWAVATYRDLYVEDARGRELTATLAVEGSSIRISFRDAGAEYPIRVDPLVAVEQAQLVPADAQGTFSFGAGVAIFEDTVVATAPFSDAAYVFVRTGDVWTEQAKLIANDGGPLDGAVAIDADTAVVGALSDDDHGTYAGAVHVFVRDGTSWTEQAKLIGSDTKTGDYFGASVALADDTLVVGAFGAGESGPGSGAAYVFNRSSGAWSEATKLLPSDGEGDVAGVGNPGDLFGASVAFAENIIFVGAPFRDGAIFDSGAIYTFVANGTSWLEQAKLPPPLANQKRFGSPLSASNDKLLVGMQQFNRAYVFAHVDDTWVQDGDLSTLNLNPSDFGQRVALFGDVAVIGAPGNDVAYVFQRTEGGWLEQDYIVASNPMPTDELPSSLAAYGDTFVAGDQLHGGTGTAYVFVVRSPDGAVCGANGECASGHCADGVCCKTACDAGPCEGCSLAAGSSKDGTCEMLTGPECDDGDACTQLDICESGSCVGTTPVSCPPTDACHDNCDPASGACTQVAKPNGIPCDDGNSCTESDACQSGVCGGIVIACPEPIECHEGGICDPSTGACDDAMSPDGTPCSVGSCSNGECTPDAVANTQDYVIGDGCACNVPGGGAVLHEHALLVFVVVAGYRRYLRMKRK